MILFGIYMVLYYVYIPIFYYLGIILYGLLTKYWSFNLNFMDQTKNIINIQKLMTLQRDNNEFFHRCVCHCYPRKQKQINE